MDLQQTLDFIHAIPRFGKTLGLAKIRELMNRMGNPQNNLRFIHVAGTNGKGSTCAMLSQILADAGYCTGLFISPYILDFRERMQLNGQMISPEELIEIAGNVKTHWESMNESGEAPSEFEVIFAIAMVYFARQKCDVVVLETGMGGRLDATNLIAPPLVSVIVSISLEHTQYLGDTLEKITAEKAAIIKNHSPAVTYPRQEPEVLAVLMERCAVTNSKLYIPHRAEILEQDITGSNFVYQGKEYRVPFGGEHQIWNALTVLETCNVLQTRGIALSYEQLKNGMVKTKFPSRLEVLHKNPYILLDGAHNMGGMQALVNALKLLDGKPVYAVVGILSHKDIPEMIELLGPCCANIITTQEPENPMFLAPEKLAKQFQPYCNSVSANNDPAAALEESYRLAAEHGGAVLICGSLYLSSVLRQLAIALSARF